MTKGLWALLCAIAVSSASADGGSGFTADVMVRLDRVGAPVLSPDGKRAVHTLRETDYDGNRGLQSLWLVDVETGAQRRLTAAGSNNVEPSFDPSGERLWFLSNRSGSMQVHSLDLGGGEARQHSRYPLDVGGYLLAPDGRSMALTFEVFPDCATLACTRERLDAPKAGSGQVYDQLFVRHWDRWKDGRRNQLFHAVLTGEELAAEPVRVSRGIDGDVPGKPFAGMSEVAFAPDAKSLYFSARIAGRSEPWSTNFDLYQAKLNDDSAPTNLTASNPAGDTNPLPSADGKRLYYLAMSRPGFEADRQRIMELDLARGQARELAPNWDRSPHALKLDADGKNLLVTAEDIGSDRLFRVAPGSGEVNPLSTGGRVEGFAASKRHLVYSRSTLTAPAQLYRSDRDGGNVKALTDFNRARLADVRMGEPEQFSFKGWNDETVYGYIVKPWNYREGQRYPVAFLIHGGPQGSFGDSFHYRWNPQTYAGAGYVAVMVDFHGSTGYGQAFTDSISQHWGDRPLEDLQKGLAAVAERYPFADTTRACALGGSYGGFMVSYIAGHWPDGFKCLVNHAGVSELRSMYYTTEELWFTEWEMGGTYYDNPEGHERFNPMAKVDAWKAPMLVIHGELDYRVPYSQGLATFTALQRRGIPSRLLHYADENHWILKPKNSVQWHAEVKAWMARWLQ